MIEELIDGFPVTPKDKCDLLAMAQSCSSQMTFPDRIPFNSWINSQLSIARYFGGLKLQGREYRIDPKTQDLVLVVPMERKKRVKK
jgi:hypothetical protein